MVIGSIRYASPFAASLTLVVDIVHDEASSRPNVLVGSRRLTQVDIINSNVTYSLLSSAKYYAVWYSSVCQPDPVGFLDPCAPFTLSPPLSPSVPGLQEVFYFHLGVSRVT
jgi:hypothetical protein